MKIGELSEKSRYPVKTIRYYEDIGILDRPTRDINGYRNYDKNALNQLQFIRNGQAAGLKLKEIMQILAIRKKGEIPCQHVRQLLRHHLEEVIFRLNELEEAKENLEYLLTYADSFDQMDCNEESVCTILNSDRAK